MKKIFTFIVLSLISLQLQAQKVLKIEYSEFVIMKLDSTKYSKEQLKAMKSAMDEKRPFQLIVQDHRSVYEAIPKINNQNSSSGISVSFSSGNSYIYKDVENMVYMTEETYPKSYIIKDKLEGFDWQLVNETKEILNCPTQKAVADFNGYELTAWYCPKYPISQGPKNYWGAPGLIYSMEIKHQRSGQITMVKIENLTEIEETKAFRKVEKDKNKPTISRAEFNDLFEEFIRKEDEMLKGGVDKD